MESPAEAQAYDEMDHREVNQTFVDDLLSLGIDSNEMLDLGTGTARIAIEFCRRDVDARIVAADLSIAMLDVARINVEIAGLMDRILLVHSDSKQLEFADDRFSVVMSNSLIHHLPEPILAFQEALRVTQPDGTLFFRDLLRPAESSDVQSFVQQYAESASPHAQQLFAESLCAALNLPEVRKLVQQLGFSPDTVQATSDRHWTWTAVKSNRATV